MSYFFRSPIEFSCNIDFLKGCVAMTLKEKIEALLQGKAISTKDDPRYYKLDEGGGLSAYLKIDDNLYSTHIPLQNLDDGNFSIYEEPLRFKKLKAGENFVRVGHSGVFQKLHDKIYVSSIYLERTENVDPNIKVKRVKLIPANLFKSGKYINPKTGAECEMTDFPLHLITDQIWVYVYVGENKA